LGLLGTQFIVNEMNISKLYFFKLGIILLTQSNLLFLAINQSIAAEKITFRYGIFSEDITNKQLEEFSLSGTLDTPLGNFLKQNASLSLILQHSLNQELPVNIIALDKALNHIIGDLLLDRIGQVIQMPAGDSHRQALRSAIILSAKDNKLSILELIKNYPDEQVVIDGEKLKKLQDDMNKFGKIIQSFFSKNQ
jgi:Mor family transcriptional regulator